MEKINNYRIIKSKILVFLPILILIGCTGLLKNCNNGNTNFPKPNRIAIYFNQKPSSEELISLKKYLSEANNIIIEFGSTTPVDTAITAIVANPCINPKKCNEYAKGPIVIHNPGAIDPEKWLNLDNIYKFNPNISYVSIGFDIDFSKR